MSSWIKPEDLEKIRSHIPYGYERVEPFLESTSPIKIMGKDMAVPKMDGPSVVWITDKISCLLQRLCIHVKNVSEIKRLIVHVLDVQELASVINNPAYHFLLTHPAIRIVASDPKEPMSLKDYFDIFKPFGWDIEHSTDYQYVFSTPIESHSQWLSEIKAMYHNVQFMTRNGLGNPFNTVDTFLGFKNTMVNLPTMLREPDYRNWGGLMKNQPTFLIGAGPSAKELMPYLKEIKGRALFIAADTMLKPLANNGIEPQIICSIERDKEIIGLLSDPREHPETILCAKSVLDPECFEVYQGPQSIYMSLYPESKWAPFRRSRMRPGHSCMGLAMGLAAYMGCNPIYLVGIDLCWSEQGLSHMPEVPYLQDKSYQEQNQRLRMSAFTVKNRAGREVQTNRWWSLFKMQFEGWVKNIPNQVFNLSENGLELEGAPFVKPQDVKLLPASFSYAGLLRKQRYYKVTEESRKHMLSFIRHLEIASEGLQRILPKMQTATPVGLLGLLKAEPYYTDLLMPVLRADLYNLDKEDEEKAAASVEHLKKYIPNTLEVFESTRNSLLAFAERQKREKFDLY